MLDHCKWDPQVGDVGTLNPFPLFLARSHWKQLSTWAERLAAETAAAECELLTRPDLHRRLGVPRKISRVLRASEMVCGRLMRFDFHWTTDGWQLSEVNADVPGGLAEAGAFSQLMLDHVSSPAATAGNPAAMWADVIAEIACGNAVALLSAAGFMEDHQVMAHLATHLRARGLRCHLAGCGNLRWTNGAASLHPAFKAERLGAIVRFVQAEWLPRACGWQHFFAAPRTAVFNSATSILVESKRFPLVWDQLRTPLPTWRALLPSTVDARTIRTDANDWILKTAYCNTGDTVIGKTSADARRWRKAMREAWLWTGEWIAQKRFATVPFETPAGSRFPCLGVFTVAGRAAGIYGRLSEQPVVNYLASDVAVLIEDGLLISGGGSDASKRNGLRGVGTERVSVVGVGEAGVVCAPADRTVKTSNRRR